MRVYILGFRVQSLGATGYLHTAAVVNATRLGPLAIQRQSGGAHRGSHAHRFTEGVHMRACRLCLSGQGERAFALSYRAGVVCVPARMNLRTHVRCRACTWRRCASRSSCVKASPLFIDGACRSMYPCCMGLRRRFMLRWPAHKDATLRLGPRSRGEPPGTCKRYTWCCGIKGR